MQSPSSSSSDSHALSITKLTAVPEVLHMVFDMLFPHELGNLSLACKSLHACVFSEGSIRRYSILRALDRSRHAEVLPNGGFRLYTSMCRQFIDIRVLQGAMHMIPEVIHFNTAERPLVLMRHAGVRYIGRYPDTFCSEAGEFRVLLGLLTAGNPMLLNAHSVRVHNIEHIQREPGVVWTNVSIGVYLDERAHYGECFATMRFVPDGW